MQEGLFHIPGFTFTWVMTLSIFTIAASYSQLERLQRNETVRKGPWTSYLFIGALAFIRSLNHVNYPISIVFKSAKGTARLAKRTPTPSRQPAPRFLRQSFPSWCPRTPSALPRPVPLSNRVPPQLAGFLVLRKRYSGLEYLSSFLFFLGLTLFTLAGAAGGAGDQAPRRGAGRGGAGRLARGLPPLSAPSMSVSPESGV
eukprot:tig00021038_g17546.t1